MTEEKKEKPKGATYVSWRDPVASAAFDAKIASQPSGGPTARAIKAIQAGQDVKLTVRQKKD